VGYLWPEYQTGKEAGVNSALSAARQLSRKGAQGRIEHIRSAVSLCQPMTKQCLIALLRMVKTVLATFSSYLNINKVRMSEMSRQDDNIVKCARRMIEKLDKSPAYKYNGEFPKPVQVEIERMKNNCKD